MATENRLVLHVDRTRKSMLYRDCRSDDRRSGSTSRARSRACPAFPSSTATGDRVQCHLDRAELGAEIVVVLADPAGDLAGAVKVLDRRLPVVD